MRALLLGELGVYAVLLVSILARTEMRALPCQSDKKTKGKTCFNPRPHRDAGATGANANGMDLMLVSILARTEMRALQRIKTYTDAERVVSILARTEMRALQVAVVGEILGKAFQSSPAPRCGRYKAFKIRPEDVTEVSILARTEMRALPVVLCVRAQAFLVSILARTEMRALPCSDRHCDVQHLVSILARTEMRALRNQDGTKEG